MSKNFIQFVRNFTLVILSFVTATTSLAANFGDTTAKYKVNNTLFKNYDNKQHAVLRSLADLYQL